MDEPHPRLAIGYIPPVQEGRSWTSNVFSIPPVGGPDGGAYCTARDLDRFLTAVEDGVLVQPATAALLTTAQTVLPAGGAYGYGVWVFSDESPVRIGLLGEDPGFSARAYRYPDTRLQAVILSNITNGAAPTGWRLSSLLGIEPGSSTEGQDRPGSLS